MLKFSNCKLLRSMAELFSVRQEELALNKIKKEMFFSTSDGLYSIVSPSAYDTAWLAMIPDPHHPGRPLFPECLTWLLENQSQDGFWGEPFGHLASLIPSALACMVALKKWNVGSHHDDHIFKGLVFVHENMEKLLITNERYGYRPSWFTLVFPGMVELARSEGLELEFLEALQGPIQQIFNARQRMLEMQELGNLPVYSPMAAHLEALPASCDINLQEILVQHQSENGSLFQSPSATVCMFMATGNEACLQYLKSIVHKCGTNGVPSIYPLDEELIKLCMINHLERLRLTEQFLEEIEDILAQSHRNYMNEESRAMGKEVEPIQMYKDALAFRLLRRHGYHVSPWRFCWFLCHNDIRMHIEENYEYFAGAMFNVHRASDLMFSREEVLADARSFSRKIIEKAKSLDAHETMALISPNFQRMIEHELKLPWLARLDHLEHRMSIEEGHEMNAPIWMNKGSFSSILFYHHEGALLQLSKEAFKFRQSIYKDELEILKRWSKDTGLSDMGFGREKTTYCYLAVAATTSLPCHSETRLVAAKSGILITVADDFYDMEGSLEELYLLTDAVKRWDGKDLKGHGKLIFNVLDDLVGGVAVKFFNEGRGNITKILQDLWYHTFKSWMTEAEWSRKSHIPSTEEYLKTGMTSIAAHTVVTMASCSINPTLPFHTMRHITEQTITKLLMVTCRLLNDIQSYQKEQKDGKMNLVLLYMKENTQADIDDSIAYLQKMLEREKKDFVEHVLMDDMCNMPKSIKEIHLGCLKAFQMFFNSTNAFDSDYEVLDNINKAIYLPLEEAVKPHGSQSSSSSSSLLSSSLEIQKTQELSIKKAQPTVKSINNLQMFRSSLVSRVAIQARSFARSNVNLPNMYPRFI